MFSNLKGTFYGFASGITWAINALLLYNVLNLYIGSKGDTSSLGGWMFLISTAFVIALVDCVMAFITELFILARIKKLGEFRSTLFSKDSFAIIPAACCAGLLGAVPYAIASSYNSPLALTLSTMFPAVGAIFAVLWFKEKLTVFKFVGILVTITGAAVITGLGERVPWFVYLIAIIPSFGYAFESLFGYSAMRADIHPEVTTVMRRVYIIALLFIMYLICCIFTGDFGYIFEVISGFDVNAEMFPFLSSVVGTKGVIWVILYIGSAGSALSYAAWYYGMEYSGVGTAQSLNITYSAFLVLFLALPPFNVSPSTMTVLGVAIITIGALIVAYESVKADKEARLAAEAK